MMLSSLFARSCVRSLSIPTRRSLHSAIVPRPRYRSRVLWASVFAFAASCAIAPIVHLDAEPRDDADSITDPDTSIVFPSSLKIPTKTKSPTLSLIGVGVRRVTILGIKVYSIGFYADLENPNLTMPKDMPSAEKLEHIVRNTACVVRIVPTRTTSYTHLRDAFMRALQARMATARKLNSMSDEEAQEAGSPMRKLKSLFPNSPLVKHTPLDVFLTPPIPGQQRALVFRDMGAVESNWVATELVLHYFEGEAPSPALKTSVFGRLEHLEK